MSRSIGFVNGLRQLGVIGSIGLVIGLVAFAVALIISLTPCYFTIAVLFMMLFTALAAI
jgi:hypothetical protein